MFKEFKEHYLFWTLFIVFFILWTIATLIFWSSIKKNDIEMDATLIGSYVNVLVFIATIFTPIAAYFFYDNWKIQHNKTLLSNEAKKLLKPLLEEHSLLLELEIKINEQYETQNNRFTITDNKLVEIFKKYCDITKKNNLEHAFFNFLAEKRTSELYNKYLTQGGKLICFHNKCSKDLESYSSVKEKLQELIEELELDIQNLTNDLKSYILIK